MSDKLREALEAARDLASGWQYAGKQWDEAQEVVRLVDEALAAPTPPERLDDAEPDVADIIAGALKTSRAHAYELMEEAVQALRKPAAQGELTDEQIDDCMPLGIAPYSTLVGQAEIRRFAHAAIAAYRAARAPEILAAIEYLATIPVSPEYDEDRKAAQAVVERLVRGERS
ncbi:MAG TPA: hypothetical protein VNV16_03930 [Methylibium sp.]|nr:hypothetical protein [Methylibium sp.]